LLGAALGWETAKCIIGAKVTLGTSCIGFFVLVGGLMAASKKVADYLAADRELTRQGGLNEQATDKLADLRGQP